VSLTLAKYVKTPVSRLVIGSGGSTLEQGVISPQFLALQLQPQFGMMQQKVVTMNNITLLRQLKRLRIIKLLALYN